MLADHTLKYLMDHQLSSVSEIAEATGDPLTRQDLSDAESRGMVTRAGTEPERWSLSHAGTVICQERLNPDQ